MSDTGLHLGLDIALQPGFNMGVANNDRVLCHGTYKVARVCIGAEVFHIDLYVLAL